MGAKIDAGTIGSIGGIASNLIGAFAGGSSASAQYDLQAAQAKYQSEATAQQYDIAGLSAIIDSEAKASGYEIQGMQYEAEAEKYKGQAALYEAQATASDAEHEYALRNANVLKFAGSEAVKLGGQQETELRKQGAAFRGEQRAAVASQGTAVDTGTPLELLRQTDEGIERDALTLRMNAQKQKYGYDAKAMEQWIAVDYAAQDAKNYRTAAGGANRAAALIANGAPIMQKAAALAREMGITQKDAYDKIAGIVRDSGASNAASLSRIGSSMQKAYNYAGIGQAIGSGMSLLAGNYSKKSAATADDVNISTVPYKLGNSDRVWDSENVDSFELAYPDFSTRHTYGF